MPASVRGGGAGQAGGVCAGSLLAANQIFRPAAGMVGRVNEFRASVRFGDGHIDSPGRVVPSIHGVQVSKQ